MGARWAIKETESACDRERGHGNGSRAHYLEAFAVAENMGTGHK